MCQDEDENETWNSVILILYVKSLSVLGPTFDITRYFTEQKIRYVRRCVRMLFANVIFTIFYFMAMNFTILLYENAKLGQIHLYSFEPFCVYL